MKEIDLVKKGTARRFCKQALQKAPDKTNVSAKALQKIIEEVDLFVVRAVQHGFLESRKQKRKTILLSDIAIGLTQSKYLFVLDLVSELEWRIKEIKKEVSENDSGRRELFEKNQDERKE